jgi:hypothetical protein
MDFSNSFKSKKVKKPEPKSDEEEENTLDHTFIEIPRETQSARPAAVALSCPAAAPEIVRHLFANFLLELPVFVSWDGHPSAHFHRGGLRSTRLYSTLH